MTYHAGRWRTDLLKLLIVMCIILVEHLQFACSCARKTGVFSHHLATIYYDTLINLSVYESLYTLRLINLIPHNVGIADKIKKHKRKQPVCEDAIKMLNFKLKIVNN